MKKLIQGHFGGIILATDLDQAIEPLKPWLESRKEMKRQLMGFPSTIFGYIKVEGDLDEALKQIERLPSVSAEEWLPLPREIFSAVNPPHTLTNYQAEHILHFGLCAEEIHWEWAEWLEKFERLFKSMPATEAFVVLQIVYWSSEEFDGRFYYKWSLGWAEEIPVAERNKDNRTWVFRGGPATF